MQVALVLTLILGVGWYAFNNGSAEENNRIPDQDNNNNNDRIEEDPTEDYNDPFSDPSFEYFRTKEEVKNFLTDYEVMARTLWGEGRSSPDYELEKIALVILNRLNSSKYPNSIKEVCLQKYQFSVWNELYNPNDNYYDNSSKAMKVSLNDNNYNRCLRIAKKVVGCYPQCNDIPKVYNYILNTDDVMIVDNTVALSYASWSVGMNVIFKGDDHIFLRREYYI